MSGNITGDRRSGSGRAAARPGVRGAGRNNWMVSVSISLLVVCGILLVAGSIVFVLSEQLTFTESAASDTSIVVDSDKRKHGEPGEDCPSGRCPQIVAQLPAAQNPGSETVAPPVGLQRTGPETAVTPPEAQKPGSETGAPPAAAQRTGPETVVLPPEAQKPGSETVDPPAAAEQGPETVVLSPKAQKPGSETVGPPLEARKSGREAHGSPLPQLVLPDEVANKVGHKIWLNETGGNRDAITSWNANEQFASLGIGHFIWFPASKTAPFEESFPQLLEFLRSQNARLPGWVDKTPIPPCPWISRADFAKHFNSPEMVQLRQFLLSTVAGQTQFLVMRAQGAMDKILSSTPEGVERQHIITQFSRIAHASKDLYPLIDYINFKGEGTNPAETAPDKQTGTRQGWGLKQVLLKMNGTTSEPTAVLGEFTDAAQSVLSRRIRNIPANRMWGAGWSHRVETYRRPISNSESNPKGTRSEPSPKDG